MVERGCYESSESCEGEAIRGSGGEEIAAIAWCGGAEGDEAQDQVPVGETEGAVGSGSETVRSAARV
jgi:hypothetical protein